MSSPSIDQPEFASIDPASGEIVWRGRAAGAADVARAVAAARHAFEDWSAVPLDQRADHLRRYASELSARRAPLVEAICRETGKPRWEAHTEVNAMIAKVAISLDAYHDRRTTGVPPVIFSRNTGGSPVSSSGSAGFQPVSTTSGGTGCLQTVSCRAESSTESLPDGRGSEAARPEPRPPEADRRLEASATIYKPHGVLAVLGPFNMPGHLPNGHIVPALLAGNCVIFKPSEQTPLVGELMTEAFHAAGLPAGVLTLIQGAQSTGASLVTAPDIDGVLFTGSAAAGRAISRALADHPEKILALEMGGNAPLIVHDVADLDAAAYLTIQSAYITAGQRCSCARRLILIDGDESRRFLDCLTVMMARIRVGPYTDTPEPFMGPVATVAAAQRVLGHWSSLLQRGAAPLADLRPLNPLGTLLSPGLIDVTSLATIEDEEFFGPLLHVWRVRDFDAAIREANRTRYGLAAGLLSDNATLWDTSFRKVRAGVVNWNRQTTGASSRLPFGGVGISGNHRPSGFWAADYCSYPVASLQRPTVTMPTEKTPGIDA